VGFEGACLLDSFCTYFAVFFLFLGMATYTRTANLCAETSFIRQLHVFGKLENIFYMQLLIDRVCTGP
jgi:hypothetical protein